MYYIYIFLMFIKGLETSQWNKMMYMALEQCNQLCVWFGDSSGIQKKKYRVGFY